MTVAYRDTYRQGLSANSTGWGSYTIRQIIPASRLAASGSKVKLTLTGASTISTVLTGVWIGEQAASGDAYDFAATPTPVLFSGAAGVTIAANATVTSDEVTFALDETKTYVVSFQLTSTEVRGTTGPSGTSYYKSGASDGATVNATGYTAYTVYLILSKIEAYGSDGGLLTDGAAGSYSFSANNITLVPLTTPAAGVSVSKMSAVITTATAGDKFKAVIYSRSGSDAPVLLGTSAEVTVTTGQSAIDFTFASPVSLAASTEYFFGFHNNNTTTTLQSSSSTAYWKSGVTYASGPPSSVSSLSTTGGFPTLAVTYTEVAAVTGTGSKALSAITGTASGTFKKKTGGNGGGSTPGSIAAGDKYATKVVMPETGTITSLILDSNQAKSVNTRMALYADNAGVPGARIALTGTKASVVVGENEYTLTTPYIVGNAQTIWIALQADAQINWLLGSQSGGSYSNADAFSDGISDPFGAGTVQNTKAPLLAVYFVGAQPGVISDYTATGAGTLGAITGTASGKLGMTGTGSRALSGVSGTASGAHGKTGTGSGGLPGITGACLGAQTDVGFGAGALAAVTGAGSGLHGVKGTATGALAPLTGQGASGGVFLGTGTGTLPALTGSGSGQHTVPVTPSTGKPFFPFRTGGDETRPRPSQPQDLTKIWEKDPEPVLPITGFGGARLRPISGIAYGQVGRQGQAQAVLMAVGGAARARFADTVSSDNELLLLAS